jgi:hypothetical protein
MATNSAAFASLTYEAPFLVEKLLKERIAETENEANALIREVKRYIFLVQSDSAKTWEMYSLRIDEAWHQFVLFTAEYIEYGRQFFGGYIDHSPSNAPKHDAGIEPKAATTFDEFRHHYTALFGEELPDLWYDERSITLNRRILNDHQGTDTLRLSIAHEVREIRDESGQVLFAINSVGHTALEFIFSTSTFYVRELPGDLSGEEKVALISTLVQLRLLRVGS